MRSFRVALLLSLALPALTWADGSRAYVLSNGDYLHAPGSITPFHPTEGLFGPAFFAPPGGFLLAVAPGTGEIWEVARSPQDNSISIAILNPHTGATLSTIPLRFDPTVILFDASGRYAYIS